MILECRSKKMTLRFHGRNSATGFSLVELMVVIAIMLLLAAIALPRLLDAQMRAYEASAVSFLKILQSNQEAYRLAHGSYADNFTDLDLNALGPAGPGGLFAPDELPQLAALFSGIGPFSVYAAQTSQQPPDKTPPPQAGDPGFGGKQPPKKRGPAGGTLGGPGSGGTGSGGSGGAGKGRSSGTGGSGRPRKGAGGGSSLGGTPSGGGTGSAAPAESTAPQTGGGSGGSLSPSPAPAQKSNNVVLKHNYIFTLLRPTLTTWTCTVAPIRDRGNSKFFYFDQTGVMRVELGKVASVSSPQM
jgi:prepilin-type N-terminal cleavage/methylation domain-containing protein